MTVYKDTSGFCLLWAQCRLCRKEVIMDHKKEAGELFESGYNCAQSVFAAFSDITGMNREEALRMSSPFGGGMGRMREVCGAMSGVFMVLGILYGYDEPDRAAQGELYALVQKAAERFKEKNKTIICRELLAGLKADSAPTPSVRDEKYYKVRPCVRFVEDAAELLDEIIASKADDVQKAAAL